MTPDLANAIGPLLLQAVPRAWASLPAVLKPFLPALLGAFVVLVIELGFLWSGRSARANWWPILAFGAIGVFVLIWDSWSRGTPMAALADTPDSDGLRFRLMLLGYGLLSVGAVLLMIAAGVRQIIREEIPVTGIPIGIVRLLPTVAVPILLVDCVRTAVSVFDGIVFRLFY